MTFFSLPIRLNCKKKVPVTFPVAADEGAISKTCSSGGEQYSHRETWMVDDCTKCICDAGHTSCTHYTCPQPNCPNPIKRPGACCPMCPGEFLFETDPSEIHFGGAKTPFFERAHPMKTLTRSCCLLTGSSVDSAGGYPHGATPRSRTTPHPEVKGNQTFTLFHKPALTFSHVR